MRIQRKTCLPTKLVNQLDSDPTITRLSSLQSHLRNLENNNEITDAHFKAMRSQNTCPAKATGLPKNISNSIIYHLFNPS